MPWFGVGSNRVWLSARNVLANIDHIDVIERALFQFDDEEGVEDEIFSVDDDSDDGVCNADAGGG